MNSAARVEMRTPADGTAAAVRPLLELRAQLGEGLHWDATRGCLWLVDIEGQRLIRWVPGAARWDEWDTPQRLGWVLPRLRGDELVLGFAQGMARALIDGNSLEWSWIRRPYESQPWMRLNDAKMDSYGTIWAGSMNQRDETSADGCLLRLRTDGNLTCIDSGYAVPNGPAIRADGRLMLHTDSARRVIYAFDLNVSDGSVSNKREWRRFGPDEGSPDGMCFDRDGCVWVAHWGAGCVCRYGTDGRLLRRVPMPATLVTNVCFCGPGLARLVVTTARRGLDAGQLAREPLAGSLFEVLDPRTSGFHWA